MLDSLDSPAQASTAASTPCGPAPTCKDIHVESSAHVQRDGSKVSELLFDVDHEDAIFDLKDGLRAWVVQHNVTHRCLSDLLQLLRKSPGMSDLSKCAATLMRTPRVCEGVSQMGSGHHRHLGLTSGLKHVCNKEGASPKSSS